MAFRRERGDSFIREELTLAVRNQLSDPSLDKLVITDVVLTKDRRFARVYVSCYGGEEALQSALSALQRAKGLLRRHLSQVLTWRFTPELGFYADRAWQYGDKMDALFAMIEQEQAEQRVQTQDQADDDELENLPEDEGEEDQGDDA